LVDADLVARCHQVELRVQPWAIDAPARMAALIELDDVASSRHEPYTFASFVAPSFAPLSA
jgi:hypothetical protein